MRIGQSVLELQRGRRPTTADLQLHRFYRKVTEPKAQLVDPGGWSGGDAFLTRLANAPSPFSLEQELKDAELFGGWLSQKTKDRAARIAEVRLAKLRGKIPEGGL